MITISKKDVLNELRRSVITCGIFYAFAFIVLLGYRWQTKLYYKGQMTKYHREQQDQKNKKKVKTIVEKVGKKNPYEVYENEIQQLTNDFRTTKVMIDAQLTRLNGYLTTLESIGGKSSTTWADLIVQKMENNDDTTIIKMDQWKRLMSTSSLQDLPDDEIKDLFDSAAKEVKSLLGAATASPSSSSTNWNAVSKIFKEESTNLVVREESVLVCPTAAQEIHVAKKTTFVDANAAHETDLQERLDRLDQLFSMRSHASGISMLLPDNRKEVEETVAKLIDSMLVDIVSFANELEQQIANNKDNSNKNSSCFDLEFVTALVDAGLTALAVNDDVRDALRKTALDRDPTLSEDSLILDADLPVEQPHKEIDMKINLRSVIDSPLIINLIQWIDQFVDLVGGYNDRLDLYLDSISHESGSIGELLVERLLCKAGFVDVDVKRYGDKLKIPRPIQQKIVQKLS
jgi:hypothetical protein